MSRTYRKRILFNNGMQRYTGNKMRPYCSLYSGWSLKFWYTQIGYDAKEKMRNANRALNKRTRQYHKKQIYFELLDFYTI